MKPALLLFLFACAGTQKPTVIASPQDFERETTAVVDRVIAIFRDGGINCNMVSGELRSVNDSQRVAALRAWRKDHPESEQTVKSVVAARKSELEQVMKPAARQCSGGPIERLVGELTQ
ncbi:MAG: hypothetical protein SFX73_04320 [Kofleriaceae bacterium]|nr:hypothetical protein [Kofleriaceae bacterium]